MRKTEQQRVDDAIIDHLAANDPDLKVQMNYWRKQYNTLLDHNLHDHKERKRMDLISRILCYTIYTANIVYSTTRLCGDELGDSTQRLLMCLVLAMNVGFGVFVLMSRSVMKLEKDRIDYHWKTTQEMLELKNKLDIAEHNLECLKSEKSAKIAKSTPKTAEKPTKSDKKPTKSDKKPTK